MLLTQEGSGDHASLLKDCLEAVQHHRFADTNPRDVEDQYTR